MDVIHIYYAAKYFSLSYLKEKNKDSFLKIFAYEPIKYTKGVFYVLLKFQYKPNLRSV